MKNRGPSSQRLLFVNFSKGWGGGEEWNFGITKALKERGYEVELMVWPESPLHQRATQAGILCHPIKGRFLSLLNPFRVHKTYKKLKKIGPAVIFLNASHELKFTGLLAKWIGISQIIYVRGLYFPVKPTFINKWYMRHVITRIATTAASIWQGLVQNFPSLAQRKYLVLPTFIDPEKWERTPGVIPIPNRIGIISRLTHEKGVARGIKAFARLVERSPQAELLVVGDGLEKEKLEAWVQSHDLTEKVTFVGFQSDVKKWLETCVALVLPSYGEGGSIALKEAMILEIPPVVFDVASMDEVIVHEKTGFIVPDDDLEAMADALFQLIEDPSLQKKMGEAGKRHVMNHFTLEFIVPQLISWLDDAVQFPKKSTT